MVGFYDSPVQGIPNSLGHSLQSHISLCCPMLDLLQHIYILPKLWCTKLNTILQINGIPRMITYTFLYQNTCNYPFLRLQLLFKNPLQTCMSHKTEWEATSFRIIPREVQYTPKQLQRYMIGNNFAYLYPQLGKELCK